MSDAIYRDAQRALQDKFATRKLADTVSQVIIHDALTDEDKAFIHSRDFFFLSTVNADGWPTVSYKGGAQGIVTALDDKTLVFPSYDGNGMFLSMGNIAASPRIGMLFIDFERPHRTRVQATAELSEDAGLLARYPGAELVVTARIAQIWINCPRYIHRMNRVETSRYVPDAQGKAPMPAWKRIDAIQDSLPAGYQGRADKEGGLISIEDYEVLVREGKG
jgi:predicted pyridoxine 5'-phosphate oxidase superfamily flavin-nucleotide-binding protein